MDWPTNLFLQYSEPLKILFLLVYSFIYGWYEYFIFSHGFHTGPMTILGKIAPYHLFVLFFIWVPQIILGYYWILGIALVIEDQSFFLFDPRDELDEEDWIAQLYGWWKPLGIFIPKAYAVLLLVSVGLFLGKYLWQFLLMVL